MGDQSTRISKQGQNITIILLSITTIQLFVVALSVERGSVLSDGISLVLFIISLVMIYVCQPELYLKYLWFVIISIWGIAAVYMLENGSVHLRGKFSFHYGSFPVYCAGWIVFWSVISWREIKTKYKLSKCDAAVNYQEIVVRPSEVRTLKMISYTAVGWITLCFLFVVNKPYFLYGIDRIQYNQNIMPTIVSNSIQILYAVIPLPVMLRKENKWIPIIYCGLFLLLNIWCGEKFTGLIVVFYFVLLASNPMFVSRKIGKYIKKIIFITGVILGSLLVLVVVQQFILGIGISNIGNYLEQRIAAQGEVWWLMYAKDSTAGMHLDELSDEIDVLINQPTGAMPDYYFGIYKMMKLFLYSDWVKYALAYGARATESTRATFFYYGKVPGLIIGQILLALLLYVIVNKSVKACNDQNWLHACLLMYVMRSAITASIMSDFQLLTTKKMIFVYMVLVFTAKMKFVIGSGHK